jgi:Transglutaminase-like superfamily
MWPLRVVPKFGRLPRQHRWLIVEAVVWLALARAALLVVPFRVIAARLGSVAPPAHPGDTDVSAPALSPDHRQQARDIGWCVTRAARYTPFRAVCLPQALAAKFMLRRRNVASIMHFGIARREGQPLLAHAWLDTADVPVTGFPVEPDFVEIARFV